MLVRALANREGRNSLSPEVRYLSFRLDPSFKPPVSSHLYAYILLKRIKTYTPTFRFSHCPLFYSVVPSYVVLNFNLRWIYRCGPTHLLPSLVLCAYFLRSHCLAYHFPRQLGSLTMPIKIGGFQMLRKVA